MIRTSINTHKNIMRNINAVLVLTLSLISVVPAIAEPIDSGHLGNEGSATFSIMVRHFMPAPALVYTELTRLNTGNIVLAETKLGVITLTGEFPVSSSRLCFRVEAGNSDGGGILMKNSTSDTMQVFLASPDKNLSVHSVSDADGCVSVDVASAGVTVKTARSSVYQPGTYSATVYGALTLD